MYLPFENTEFYFKICYAVNINPCSCFDCNSYLYDINGIDTSGVMFTSIITFAQTVYVRI